MSDGIKTGGDAAQEFSAPRSKKYARRCRQSDCRELHCRFDPEGVTGGPYPPLYFRPWLVVTPKLFIPWPL